jgi:hypothetical protein
VSAPAKYGPFNFSSVLKDVFWWPPALFGWWFVQLGKIPRYLHKRDFSGGVPNNYNFSKYIS